MELIKSNLKSIWNYIKILLKWVIAAGSVGAVGGAVGSVFHISVDYVTGVREQNSWVMLLLPLGGVAISAMYSLFRSKGSINTDRVLESVRDDKDVPLIMTPLIFVSTVITHFLGGSAGREGAALQLGGSIGYNLGRVFRLSKNDMRLIVMSGMSGVFAALFGTPITAAVFALEVTDVGIIPNGGFLPCVIAAITAHRISLLFGITPVRFDSVALESFDAISAAKVAVLAVLCACVSIIFCMAIKKCRLYMSRLIRNEYLRAAIGGAAIVLLTAAVQTADYNGAGMGVISAAMAGHARPEAFILKIIFTAVTISAGFKGGEIVPAFFVGSTFGCVAAQLLGLEAGFGAAIGFVSLFCSVVNCPIASVMLSVEVFGAQGLLFFAIACGVSYVMSGRFGLYKSQKIVYSKLDAGYINADVR